MNEDRGVVDQKQGGDLDDNQKKRFTAEE